MGQCKDPQNNDFITSVSVSDGGLFLENNNNNNNKTELTASVLKKDPKHTRDLLKNTPLLNRRKQDKTCTFSRKSSFSSYVNHKDRKTNN